MSFSHPRMGACWAAAHREAFEAAVRHALGSNFTFIYINPDNAALAADDSFSTFLTNGKNDLALKAVRELCGPAGNVRALLILGESGSGKSHLLQAAATALGRSLGRNAVLAVSAASLPPQRFWENGIALLADDVQLLTGDKAGEESLAAHAEAARAPGRILMLAASGNEIPAFSVRLRQRLQAMLSVSLSLPDISLRIIWLEKQNAFRELGLNSAQILALARQGRHFRELEGLLQKFDFYGRMVNRQWAWDKLARLASPEQTQPWLKVFAIIGERFGVSRMELAGTSRRREIVFARQAAMYLARQKLGLSYQELGRIFGGRDHATVIHSIRKIEQLRQVDKDLHNVLTELAEKIF